MRSNGGIETIAIAPKNGPLRGAAVVVSERSVDKADNLFAGILEGPMKGAFTVVRADPYSVTDGAFLPDGDLLLLERRFNFASGLGMRIRRIAAGGHPAWRRGRRRRHARSGHELPDRQYGGARRHLAARRRDPGDLGFGRQPLDPRAKPDARIPADQVKRGRMPRRSNALKPPTSAWGSALPDEGFQVVAFTAGMGLTTLISAP
ncbi:esterase-like activity of phytase family protein [Sinorhizobium meliloti]|nr:esterase-like activity of phytase family protein [Sinorhizobium meliloti]